MDVLGELHLFIDYPHREASATAVEAKGLPVVGMDGGSEVCRGKWREGGGL
jgi:hypothetical protein